jgi:hypothetical protein
MFTVEYQVELRISYLSPFTLLAVLTSGQLKKEWF